MVIEGYCEIAHAILQSPLDCDRDYNSAGTTSAESSADAHDFVSGENFGS